MSHKFPPNKTVSMITYVHFTRKNTLKTTRYVLNAAAAINQAHHSFAVAILPLFRKWVGNEKLAWRSKFFTTKGSKWTTELRVSDSKSLTFVYFASLLCQWIFGRRRYDVYGVYIQHFLSFRVGLQIEHLVIIPRPFGFLPTKFMCEWSKC